jgi:SAM-dependent methyltransferase
MSTSILPQLSEDTYLQHRLDPSPGDDLYLHLSDLRLAMNRVSDAKAMRVLDFGCGGSPYRSLFPAAEYLRADLLGTPHVDYEIVPGDEASPLPAEAGSFDLVLSSQVLEHVPNPSSYLREARRLLKTGGTMVLTTHGIFEDHGCPNDFHRWTDSGLARELTSHHFEVIEVWKLTTGPRAVMFLLEHAFPKVRKCTLFGACFWPLQYVLLKHRAWWHKQCDIFFKGNRAVTTNLPKHRLYIGLGFIVRAI